MNLDKHRLLAIGVCLLLLLSAIPAGAQKTHPGIDIKLSAQKPLWLRVTLRSFSQTRTTIYKSDLPWGLRDSIVLIAVNPHGECLDQLLIAGDPTPEKISLNPAESVSGDIDLTEVFKDLDVAVRKSDILVFWAYQAPEGLGLPHWSGGWILIPKQKQR